MIKVFRKYIDVPEVIVRFICVNPYQIGTYLSMQIVRPSVYFVKRNTE
jgi:hypothetical protein